MKIMIKSSKSCHRGVHFHKINPIEPVTLFGKKCVCDRNQTVAGNFESEEISSLNNLPTQER